VHQGLIPEETITQIRERTDIAEVVSGYVSLSRSGQNLKGLCPFHTEKTPSFTVSPSRQIFHCFGCGAGGNVFTFFMRIEGASFPEAVRELGHRAGIQVATAWDSGGKEDASARERLERLNDAAASWFRKNLLDPATGKAASAYLADRGIRPETAEAFGLGVALPAWDGLLRAMTKEGSTTAELVAAGLVVAKEQSGRRATEASGFYDRFRGRVMFPIRDLRKRVIGFGGRVLDDGMPKYLNSSDTPLFNKGRVLYALEQARDAASRANTLVIVEGYFDAIALHQAGIRNAAATLGTALTPDHVRTLRRFVTRVVLLFDPDPAGVRAALRTLDLFVDSGVGVQVVSLPAGEDPDTFVRKRGAEAFLELQERAPSLLDFAVEHSLGTAASGAIEDRIRSVDEILRVLQKTSHRLAKEECLRRVAERLGISQKLLVDRYPELVAQDERRSMRQTTATPADLRFKLTPEERDLALLLLQGQLRAADVRALRPEAFTVPACRRIVELGLANQDKDGRVLVRPVLDAAMNDPVCAAIATELAMAERHFDDQAAYVQGCLETLERKWRQQALSDLIARLRVAEQAGNVEEARALNARVNELRLRKAGTVEAPVSGATL
jgi:DNA primase